MSDKRKSNDTIRDFLMKAYCQEHPETIEEFLSMVEDMAGKGLLLDVHRLMCQKYGTPKIGTGRVAYLSKSVVFKVPISPDGFRLNDWEASLESIGKEGEKWHIPIARSRHLPGHEIPIVVMERVTEASPEGIKTRLGYVPDFVGSVDMGQVGFTRRGKLVAFDYADL